MLLDRLYRFRLAVMLTGVGGLAGFLRFVGLSQPKTLVFDELYYARGAYSLLELGYEGRWTGESQDFARGDFSGLTDRADKVVHPPLGKWMIAAGIRLFGANPFGWRCAAALIGTITVILVALIACHLFRSVLWGGIAGVFLAVDGQHLVLSRTALLDIFLTFFVVAAFGLFLLDRRRTRRRRWQSVERERARRGAAEDAVLDGFRPRAGVRWHWLAAVVALGLATGVKWSGLYFAAVFLILAFLWEAVDRRKMRVEPLTPRILARMATPLVVAVVVLLPATYVASYSSWFVSDSSYMRHWAENHEGEGMQWLPPAARSFVEYHEEMLRFHNNLKFSKGIEHNYAARPWGFLLQVRPTAFYWEEAPAEDSSDGERYVAETMALGNPLIWWAGAVAFFYALVRLFRRFDLLAGAVAVGILGGWVPWLFFPDRVMFTFYSVAFSPWVVLCLVWALKRLAQPDRLKGGWSRRGAMGVGVFVALVLLLSGFFLPIWIGQWIPYDYWHIHILDVNVEGWNWI